MCHPPRYPGPLEIGPGDRVPGLFVLIELSGVGMEGAGRALRQTLRGVHAWLEGDDPPPEDDGRVEERIPELAATLPPLWRILREPGPGAEALEGVGLACMHVGLWAEKVAAYRTAIAFFAAAEEADPDNPHYAYNVGRMARKLALYDTAEAWLRWAHWVARNRQAWEVAALSTSGLGNLHRQRGNLPLATRFHELTRRIARRHNLRTLEGDALYDLVGMSFDFGKPKQGMEYARLAIEAYGPGHSRIYTLARDVAWLWMDSYGEFESAAHVFEALLDYIWKPTDRLLLFASLARAAAGAGWREIFEEMWIETWAMMRHQPVRDGHAAALVQLARGAGIFGYWDRAEIAADEALAVARDRQEGEAIIVAESILDAVLGGVIAEGSMRTAFADRDRAHRHVQNEDTKEFAFALTVAMRARQDGAPEGPAHPHAEVLS